MFIVILPYNVVRTTKCIEGWTSKRKMSVIDYVIQANSQTNNTEKNNKHVVKYVLEQSFTVSIQVAYKDLHLIQSLNDLVYKQLIKTDSDKGLLCQSDSKPKYANCDRHYISPKFSFEGQQKRDRMYKAFLHHQFTDLYELPQGCRLVDQIGRDSVFCDIDVGPCEFMRGRNRIEEVYRQRCGDNAPIKVKMFYDRKDEYDQPTLIGVGIEFVDQHQLTRVLHSKIPTIWVDCSGVENGNIHLYIKSVIEQAVGRWLTLVHLSFYLNGNPEYIKMVKDHMKAINDDTIMPFRFDMVIDRNTLLSRVRMLRYNKDISKYEVINDNFTDYDTNVYLGLIEMVDTAVSRKGDRFVEVMEKYYDDKDSWIHNTLNICMTKQATFSSTPEDVRERAGLEIDAGWNFPFKCCSKNLNLFIAYVFSHYPTAIDMNPGDSEFKIVNNITQKDNRLTFSYCQSDYLDELKSLFVTSDAQTAYNTKSNFKTWHQDFGYLVPVTSQIQKKLEVAQKTYMEKIINEHKNVLLSNVLDSSSIVLDTSNRASIIKLINRRKKRNHPAASLEMKINMCKDVVDPISMFNIPAKLVYRGIEPNEIILNPNKLTGWINTCNIASSLGIVDKNVNEYTDSEINILKHMTIEQMLSKAVSTLNPNLMKCCIEATLNHKLYVKNKDVSDVDMDSIPDLESLDLDQLCGVSEVDPETLMDEFKEKVESLKSLLEAYGQKKDAQVTLVGFMEPKHYDYKRFLFTRYVPDGNDGCTQEDGEIVEMLNSLISLLKHYNIEIDSDNLIDAITPEGLNVYDNDSDIRILNRDEVQSKLESVNAIENLDIQLKDLESRLYIPDLLIRTLNQRITVTNDPDFKPTNTTLNEIISVWQKGTEIECGITNDSNNRKKDSAKDQPSTFISILDQLLQTYDNPHVNSYVPKLVKNIKVILMNAMYQ